MEAMTMEQFKYLLLYSKMGESSTDHQACFLSRANRKDHISLIQATQLLTITEIEVLFH